MTAARYFILAVKLGIGLVVAYSVISVIAWMFMGGQADDDSTTVARNEGML